MGRADYHGSYVNEAARIMDAGEIMTMVNRIMYLTGKGENAHGLHSWACLRL
jgi:hypothetical protein